MSESDDLRFAIRLWQAGRITAEQFARVSARLCEQPDVSLPTLLVEMGWISPTERDRFLDSNAPLVSVDEEQTGLPYQQALAALEESGTGDPDAELLATTDHLIGERGGEGQPSRYALIREEGRGGMGRVYLARDRVLHRDVALKELLPDRDASEMIQRFHNEARITGRLQHPGIVPVYDLVARDGTLFYTMKFVRGTTLHRAALDFHESDRDNTATFRGLMASFVSLCRTMAYAHRQGVIHRDLKGANVILGDFGEALILDWGLAKDLGQGADAGLRRDADACEPALTMAGQLLGTPAFMSPEQASGDGSPIGPASDIYGLGTILYHLLTGKTPFAASNLGELLEAIRVSPPMLPRRHWPAAPAALQAICLKALAKKPEDRYPSAEALAADVQRWLDDEPVSVHSDPVLTRLLRRARRNRPALAGLVALVLTTIVALSIGLVVVGAKERRAREAERNANLHADVSRENEAKARVALEKGLNAISTALTRLSKPDLRDIPGLQPVRSELLGYAVASHDEILRVWGDDPKLRDAASQGMHMAASAVYEMGNDRRGLALIRRAAGHQRVLIAREPDNLAYRIRLAGCYIWEMALAQRVDRKELPAALKRAGPFLAELERSPLLEGRPEAAAQVVMLCGKYHAQAAAYHRDNGKTDQAIREYQHARESLRRAAKLHPANWEIQRELSLICHTATLGLRGLIPFEKLLEYHEVGMKALDAIPAARQQQPWVMQQRGNILNGRFLLMSDAGRQADAKAAIEAAVAVRGRLVERNPAVPPYRAELATSLSNQAGLLASMGDQAGALAAYERAAENLEKGLKTQSRQSNDAAHLAQIYGRIIGLQDKLKKTHEAMETILRLDRVRPVPVLSLYSLGRETLGLAVRETKGEERNRLVDLGMRLLKAAHARGFRDRERFEREIPLEVLAGTPGGKDVLTAMGVSKPSSR